MPAELYAQEHRAVYAFLWRLGARGAELEDLLHDVFVAAVRRWPTYEQSRPVRPWLLGITFRVFAHARRKQGPESSELDESLPAEGASVEQQVAAKQAAALLDRALASLRPERRAVFVMMELEGLSAPEVAEVMGANLATTYSRLRLARADVQEAVERFMAVERRFAR